jgi:hypothetical protein
MMRIIKGILAAAVLAAALCACEREEVQEQTGYLYVDLRQDFTVDPVFKSDAAEDMTFSLTIYDWKDRVVAAYDDYRQLALEPLEIRTGPYRVVAQKCCCKMLNGVYCTWAEHRFAVRFLHAHVKGGNNFACNLVLS